MIGDAKGNRFVPGSITIHVGDVVTWTNVSGAHNVVFWSDSIPAGTQAVLQGKMGATMGPLTGPLFAAPNATYTVSFAGLKADRKSTRLNSSHSQISYAVFCLKKKNTSAP